MTRKLGFTYLEKAVHTRLTTSSFTSTYRIYNYGPKAAVFPFITFGEPIGIPDGSFGNRDEEVEENSFTVNVWSDYLGDKECADMMTNIIQALTSSDLVIAEYPNPPLLQLEMADLFTDISTPQKPVRHGVMRFRIVMAPS